jgi:hypothetical protein
MTTSIVIRSKEAFYKLEELIGQAINVLVASF